MRFRNSASSHSRHRSRHGFSGQAKSSPRMTKAPERCMRQSRDTKPLAFATASKTASNTRRSLYE
ncbi:hypothetical protein MPLB_1800036 [Mesorhizobium sp. ORS 3324]|nr:hypothetical protein MPLB_1800036 [Mesorhizobium sp. ORS 3324]